MKLPKKIAVGIVAVLALTSCSDSGDSGQPGASSGESTSAPAPSSGPGSGPAPSVDPGGSPVAPPPKTPTDQVGTLWVVGTALAASSGPCYVVETDEGKQYALHSTVKISVTKGQRVRAKVGPPGSDKSCTGDLRATASALEPVS